MNYVDTADNHLRPDPPVCRKETPEEWYSFQYERLLEIVDIANENDADLIMNGDVLDAARTQSEMIVMLLDALSNMIGTTHIIGGNHSLSFHREANIAASTIGIIKAMSDGGIGKIKYHTCKEELINGRFEHSYRLNEKITIVHTLCMETEDDIPFNCEAVTPDYLFAKYDTPFICTGDYHKAFATVKDGRAVINPGCMVQQSIREKEYQPSVYLFNTDDVSSIKRIHLTYDNTLISDEHLLRKRERVAEIESVLEAMKSGKTDVSLDYIKNLYYYVEHNKVSEGAIKIIDEIKEGVE